MENQIERQAALPDITTTTSRHAFISFSSQDEKRARAICEEMERRQVTCWISARDVRPGRNYQSEINGAIRNASHLVLVFSDNANGSEEVARELSLASKNHVPICPVRITDVLPSDGMEFMLATSQWVDAFDDWEHAMERLAAEIAGLLVPHRKAPSRKRWRFVLPGLVSCSAIAAVAATVFIMRGPASQGTISAKRVVSPPILRNGNGLVDTSLPTRPVSIPAPDKMREANASIHQDTGKTENLAAVDPCSNPTGEEAIAACLGPGLVAGIMRIQGPSAAAAPRRVAQEMPNLGTEFPAIEKFAASLNCAHVVARSDASDEVSLSGYVENAKDWEYLLNLARYAASSQDYRDLAILPYPFCAVHGLATTLGADNDIGININHTNGRYVIGDSLSGSFTPRGDGKRWVQADLIGSDGSVNHLLPAPGQARVVNTGERVAFTARSNKAAYVEASALRGPLILLVITSDKPLPPPPRAFETAQAYLTRLKEDLAKLRASLSIVTYDLTVLRTKRQVLLPPPSRRGDGAVDTSLPTRPVGQPVPYQTREVNAASHHDPSVDDILAALRPAAGALRGNRAGITGITATAPKPPRHQTNSAATPDPTPAPANEAKH